MHANLSPFSTSRCSSMMVSLKLFFNTKPTDKHQYLLRSSCRLLLACITGALWAMRGKQGISSESFSSPRLAISACLVRILAWLMKWGVTVVISQKKKNSKTTSKHQNIVEYISGKSFLFTSLKEKVDSTLFSVRRFQYFISHTKSPIFKGRLLTRHRRVQHN